MEGGYGMTPTYTNALAAGARSARRTQTSANVNALYAHSMRLRPPFFAR